MKCGGMISPLASLTKPESIGCWTKACTSVMSTFEVARTRMVDAILISLFYWRMFRLPAAAADGDFDFLGGAVELAAGLHDRNHVAGLCHLEPIGYARQR